MTEITLPRRAHPQPHPFLERGGDCVSCVFGGVVGLPVAEVHALLEGPPKLGRSHMVWARVCRELEQRGLVEEHVADTPLWPPKYDIGLDQGLTSRNQSMQWWRYLRMALRAGYYALADVRFDGNPEHPPDHLVVLCGIRHWVEEGEVGAHRHDVLVSCSARHPEGRWMDRFDFLRLGGFDLVLVRPTEAA